MAIRFNKKTVFFVGAALLALGGAVAAFRLSGQEVANRAEHARVKGKTIYASLRGGDPQISEWVCREYSAGCPTVAYDP